MPERRHDEDSAPRQLLCHRFRFDSFSEAARFVGQLGDLADASQSLEVELRDGDVTVRVGSSTSELTSRETIFMERIRGIA
ncbi:MAG: hypothetical protein MPN21_10205 [Thermoanaerobaculia bacterium]|nr:hypothetical protein [Thermoanaerobaculia bacterium]